MSKYFVAILLLAGLFLAAGCNDLIDPPKITYLDTKVVVNSITELTAFSEFKISNPNPIEFVGVVEYELYVNDKHFTKGTSSEIKLLANGSADFTLQSRIDLVKVFGVVNDLMRFVGAGQKSIPFKIKGTFVTAVVGIPVKVPVNASGDIPLPSLTDLLKTIK